MLLLSVISFFFVLNQPQMVSVSDVMCDGFAQIYVRMVGERSISSIEPVSKIRHNRRIRNT